MLLHFVDHLTMKRDTLLPHFICMCISKARCQHEIKISLILPYIFLILISGVPKVTIQSDYYNVPYLSNAEIVATVQNISDFPPTTSVKWQRYNYYSYVDINITEDRYLGSTEDLYGPTLVINRVDFYSTHGSYYRCIASNPEGSWTSNNTRIYVIGSM